MKRLVPFAATLAAGLLAAGCASGPSAMSQHQLDAMIAQHRYADAEAYLGQIKDSEYGQKNAVLYHLDRGAIELHGGQYEQSEQDFSLAEHRMDELYTKSATQAGGMLLLNDRTMDYAGEPFERTLMNVYRALGYAFQGKPDDALVESRKIERFLQELEDNLGGRKGVYSDDAFARYLDAMLYADEGKLDDARISLAASRAAYRDYETNYGMNPPVFRFPKRRPKDDGELAFIHFNGLAPRKITETFQVAWNDATAVVRTSQAEDGSVAAKNALVAGLTGNAITVAYPGIVQDTYTIVGSEVFVDSRPEAATQLMEDVTGIAKKTLAERQALIKTRAVARAAIKYILAEAAYRVAAKACDQEFGSTSWQGLLCKGAAKATMAAATAVTEVADTREWSTLPAQIRMARVKLPAGTHDVVVQFKNAAGAVVEQHEFKDVVIQAGKRTYLSYRTAL
ncbi:MAG: hypothetical protein KGM24_08240 [Elusimicrobia bacterium]|nr:hypothetical protein [Elusimicrobiota bacterium]